MGRNIKKGLEYFPLTVDFFENETIAIICAKHGVISRAILIALLQRIYRNGYQCLWNEDTIHLFAQSLGDNTLSKLIKDFVVDCLNRNFFDKGLFEQYQILTNEDIQEQYLTVCRMGRRVNYQITQEYNLLKSKSSFTPEETPFNPEESTQRKEKEIKGKEIKGKSIENNSPSDRDNFKSFNEWILQNAPEVGKFKEPFTLSQYLELEKQLPTDRIQLLLRKMNNKLGITSNYRSAYETILSWSKNNFESDKVNPSAQKEIVLSAKILKV